MKKYLFGLLGIAFAGIGMFGASFADNSSNTNQGLKLNATWVKDIGVAGVNNNPDTDSSSEPQILKIVKNTINIALGFLGLITLLLLLWSGFKIVTSNGDDKAFSAGMATLKQAAIGLGFIAVSWFLVSMIFWFITKATQTG